MKQVLRGAASHVSIAPRVTETGGKWFRAAEAGAGTTNAPTGPRLTGHNKRPSIIAFSKRDFMNKDIAALEAAVKLIKRRFEEDAGFSVSQLSRIGSCAGTIRSYMALWKKRNQEPKTLN